MSAIARGVPPYAQIVQHIRRQILSGELRSGDPVPSTRQIMRDWGVAMATASRAITTLRQEGMVVAVPGRGTVVARLVPVPDQMDEDTDALATRRAAVSGRDEVSAGAATEEEAAQLGVEPGSPVLRVRRWSFDADGEVVEFGAYVSAADQPKCYEYAVQD